MKDKDYLLTMVNLWHRFSKHDITSSLKPEPEPEKIGSPNNLPTVDITPESEPPKIETKAIISQKLNVVKGAELEEAVERLFRELFPPFEIKVLGRQKSGEQFGFDIELKYRSKQGNIFEYKIECKNYQDSELTAAKIAPKIDQLRYGHNNQFEQFIIISPCRTPSNLLYERINSWNDDPAISFETCIWSPKEHVENFFGLQPDIYDKFYETDPENHPKKWSDNHRSNVIETYKKDLLPRMRLSSPWRTYLNDSSLHMLLGNEISLNYPELYGKYVDLKATDVRGKKFSLLQHVCNWLDDTSEKTMIILGEFGSGKTFFTYCLSQKLAENYRKDPKAGWIPIRLSLKDYPQAGKKNSREFAKEFLKDRFEKFNEKHQIFEELIFKKTKLLIILDGFDEMSKSIDTATVLENTKKLIECYKELKECFPCTVKFLITSRKGFFNENKVKDKIIKKLSEKSSPDKPSVKPQVVELEDISRKDAFTHLMAAAESVAQEKVKKLQYVHDPIGLATKPLFLSIMKEIVNELDETCSNIAGVYNKFICKSLTTKPDLLLHDDPDDDWDTEDDDIVPNMIEILQDISIELRKSKADFISLTKFFNNASRKQAAIRLWNLTNLNNDDAENRVFHRSLLVRSNNSDESSKNVEFCHRSICEFFVAKAICDMIHNSEDKCLDFLKECDLNNEIVYFVSQLVDNNSKQTYNKKEIESKLLFFLDKTKNKQGDDKYSRLGRNAINILHKIVEPLPGTDYSNMVLDEANLQGADLSDKNFSGTSLRKANLNNVSFKNADFRKSDLTDALFSKTFKIVAITNYDKHIYALYADNSIWKWNIQTEHLEKIISDTYGEKQKFMVLSSDKIITLEKKEKEHFVFYTKTDSNNINLEKEGHFEINDTIKILTFNDPRESIIYTTETDNTTCLEYQMTNFQMNTYQTFSQAPLCYIFGDKKIATYTDGTLKININNKSVEQTLSDVKCMAVYELDEQNYLVGIGYTTGAVSLTNLTLTNDQWVLNTPKTLKNYDKDIDNIVFLNDTTIAVANKTDGIYIINVDEPNEKRSSKHLQIKILCDGMQIDDLQRKDIEYQTLYEIINTDKTKTK